PEPLVGWLQRDRAGDEGGADKSVDRGRLRHDERQCEPTKAGRGRIRAAEEQLIVESERGAVEGLGGGGVRNFEGEGVDGGHGRSFREGRVGYDPIMVAHNDGTMQSLWPSSECAKLE